MTVDNFIMRLEEAFTPYKQGMRTAIATKLCRAGAQDMRELYQAVVEQHDRATAPTLSTILQTAKDVRIALSSAAGEWVSLCKDCDAEYDLDSFACCKCGGKNRAIKKKA